MDRHGLPRRSIAPSTAMEILLPRQGRRAHWQALGQAMEAPLPRLALSRSLSRPFAGLLAALLVFGLGAFRTLPLLPAAVVALACVLLAGMARQRLAMLAIEIPTGCATLGELVRTTVSRPASGLSACRNWDPPAVWETLRSLIGDQRGVPPEAVTVDAHLRYDLGAD